MTVGAMLQGTGDHRSARWFARREHEEEEAFILQHPQLGEEEGEESEGQEEPLQNWGPQGEARGKKASCSKKVHFAFLPERYEPLEEQTAEEKPKKKYRKKLKKYGKNVGKVITKGCHYIVIGIQGFATAYSAHFAPPSAFLSLIAN